MARLVSGKPPGKTSSSVAYGTHASPRFRLIQEVVAKSFKEWGCLVLGDPQAGWFALVSLKTIPQKGTLTKRHAHSLSPMTLYGEWPKSSPLLGHTPAVWATWHRHIQITAGHWPIPFDRWID